MNNTNSYDWTDERVALTKRLWLEGKSAGQIVQALGRDAPSRSAVMGKLHRMGLMRSDQLLGSSRRNTSSCQPRSHKMTKAARLAGKGPPLPAPAVAAAKAAVAPPPVALPVDQTVVFQPEPAGAVTVMTVASRHVCRWPIGDPLADDFTMCGRAIAGKGSFCPEHAQVAYKPTPPRKDKELASLARMMRRFA